MGVYATRPVIFVCTVVMAEVVEVVRRFMLPVHAFAFELEMLIISPDVANGRDDHNLLDIPTPIYALQLLK